MNKVPLWTVVAGLLAVLGALMSLSYRYAIEQSNRAVGILVELPTVRAFATAEGVAMPEALARLKNSGVTAIGLQEQSIRQIGAVTPQGIWVAGADAPRVKRGLRRVGIATEFLEGPNGLTVVLGDADQQDLLLSTPVGIDPDEARLATEAGLEIVARHANFPGYDAGDVRDVLAESEALGAVAYLPSGDSVLGYRGADTAAVAALQEFDLYYLTTEFSNFAGDRKVVTHIPDRTIRLHAIQQAEADRNTPDTTVERMVKAFAERNIRYLLIRPPSLAGEQPLRDFQQSISQIARGIAGEKGAVRSPRPFTQPVPPPFLKSFISAASLLAVLGVWLAFPLPRAAQIAGMGILTLIGVGSALGTAVAYWAFIVALFAPLAAYVWWATRPRPPGFGGAVVMGAIALAGGLVVAGLLNDLPYYIQLKMFTGVKAAHFAPIFIVALLLLHRQTPLPKIAAEPMRYGPVVFGFVGMAVVAFMLSRTGNDSPAGVSGFELQFRSLLDAVLPVRPRTKEFLIGHPALVVGLLWLRRDPRSIMGSVLLGAGFIGLTSVVNTLCHLHSPLVLNLTRIAVGAVLGLTLGLVAWWVISGFLREPEAAATDEGIQNV